MTLTLAIASILGQLGVKGQNEVLIQLAVLVALLGIGTRLLVWLIKQRAIAIRSIGRRLLVLLAVATAVPVVIMAVLWVLSLHLGIASERARIAARAILDEGGRLDDEVALALARPERAEERLRDLAATPRRRAEGMTVWIGPALWRRIAGSMDVDTTAMTRWPETTGDSRLFIVRQHSFVACRRPWPGDTTRIVLALVPLQGALYEEIGTRVEGRLVSSGTPGDTLRVGATAVRLARSAVGGARGGDAFSPFNGFANLPNQLWGPQGWWRANALIVLRVDPRVVLGGLFQHAIVSWVSMVPLFVMLVFFLVGLRLWFRAAGLMRALGQSITAAVEALRGGARALEAGALEHRIVTAGDDELWDVAAAFNRMAEGLERGRALELERERLESELALARRIQSRLLPARPPQVPGVDIAGLSEPARAVGGDYYDHILLPDGRVALVIADVSGKGVPAALLMSAFRASLMGQLDGTADPAVVMARVNRFLHHSVEPGRFVTAFLAVLDPRSGALEYCNAGHNPPYLVTPDGAVTTLETGGLLLGMLEDGVYAKGTAELAPGTSLTLFTDGVTEATAAGGAMWGDAPLIEMLQRGVAEPCPALARRIVDEVRRFEGDQGPSDDITLLIARRARG